MKNVNVLSVGDMLHLDHFIASLIYYRWSLYYNLLGEIAVVSILVTETDFAMICVPIKKSRSICALVHLCPYTSVVYTNMIFLSDCSKLENLAKLSKTIGVRRISVALRFMKSYFELVTIISIRKLWWSLGSRNKFARQNEFLKVNCGQELLFGLHFFNVAWKSKFRIRSTNNLHRGPRLVLTVRFCHRSLSSERWFHMWQDKMLSYSALG